MRRRLLLILIIAFLSAVHAKKKSKKPDAYESEQHQRMKQFHDEQKHYDKIHSDDVEDWTIHEDVDKTFYWFSRSLRRSQREPPKGWTKSAKTGKWLPPPRKKKEEL